VLFNDNLSSTQNHFPCYCCLLSKFFLLYSFRFFSWSISYPTASHFVGYYISNTCQLEELNEDDLSEISLTLESASSQEDALADVPQELDMVVPVCNLDEITHDIHRRSRDFHCQMDSITASLLERALRGKKKKRVVE